MTRNPDMHGTRGTGGAGVEGEASWDCFAWRCAPDPSDFRWASVVSAIFGFPFYAAWAHVGAICWLGADD